VAGIGFRRDSLLRPRTFSRAIVASSALLGSALIAAHLVLLLAVRDSAIRTIVSDVVTPLEGAMASVLLFLAALRAREPGSGKGGWILLAAGFGCMCAGDTTWSILELASRDLPFPSIADGVYLASYPLTLAGIVGLTRVPGGTADRLSLALDTALTVLSVGLLLWVFVLGPIFQDQRENGGLPSLLALLYPAGDFALLCALVIFIFERASAAPPHVRLLIMGAIVGQIVGDSSFGLKTIQGTYTSGDPGDAGYVLSYACAIAAGALQARAAPRAPAETADRRQTVPWRDFLPFLGGFVVVFILLWTRSYAVAMAPGAVTAWVVTIVALSFARQVATATTASNRARQLRISRDALERRVLERTERLAAANRELSLLVKVREAVAMELELPVVLRTIVQTVADTVGWRYVALYLREANDLVLMHYVGYTEVIPRIPLDLGVAGRVARTGSPALIKNGADEPEFLLAQAGLVSSIVAPLLQEGATIGVLIVEADSVAAFGAEDLELLQAIAFHTSSAIGRARLFSRLRESEQRSRALLDSSPDAVLITSADLRVVMANRQAAQLIGIDDPVQMYGLSALALVHPADRETIRERISYLRANGGFVSSEFLVVRPDGLTLPVETRGSLVPSRDGAEPEMIVVARDITARRMAEEELRSSHETLQRRIEERTAALQESQERLRQVEKMEAVGRLAGGVAHDFNNLLTVIIGNCQALLSGGINGPHAVADLQAALGAAERAAALTRQLLTFSRRLPLEVQAVDLNRVIGGMEDMVRRLVGQHVRVVVRRGDRLPAVMTDPVQVEQVILNLSSNAADAMPSGGVLTITTESARVETPLPLRADVVTAGDYVLLTVQDTGSGMPAEVQAHVFEPFYTTKDLGRGTGLGLSTVLGIVKQAGGHVGLSSVPQQGTAVRIWLPAVDRPAEAERVKAATDAPGGSETVLVVDDQEDVRRVTVAMLEGLGYRVMAAPSGAEALAVLAAHPGGIDLVLTDLSMPEMKGDDLASGIARHSAAPRLLLMSGYADGDISPLLGDVPFIQKPFSAPSLARAVREALDAGR
jgi:PAS domain S-box-containing protein